MMAFCSRSCFKKKTLNWQQCCRLRNCNRLDKWKNKGSYRSKSTMLGGCKGSELRRWLKVKKGELFQMGSTQLSRESRLSSSNKCMPRRSNEIMTRTKRMVSWTNSLTLCVARQPTLRRILKTESQKHRQETMKMGICSDG